MKSTDPNGLSGISVVAKIPIVREVVLGAAIMWEASKIVAKVIYDAVHSEPTATATATPTPPDPEKDDKDNDYKKLDKKELAERLNTDTDTLHREIKPEIIKDSPEAMKKIGNPKNPDILVDSKGNLALKNVKTGDVASTGTKVCDYAH